MSADDLCQHNQPIESSLTPLAEIRCICRRAGMALAATFLKKTSFGILSLPALSERAGANRRIPLARFE
jgi:hypothetical protein